MSLKIKNSHTRDSHITFDEPTHVYTIDGASDYTSVTTFIHKFFPSFNGLDVIKKMRNGKNWSTSKYNGMTNDQILKEWSTSGKESSELGTRMHLNIEKWYNDGIFNEDFIGTTEHEYFLEFLEEHKFVAYRTEWEIYTKKYKIAGSVDIVFIDPDDPSKHMIGDWKRVREIKYENKYEKAFEPIEHLDVCNYWQYTLQLNMYRMILEKYYKLCISKLFLVVIHPDNDTYIKIDVPILSVEIISMLKKHPVH